MLSRAVSDGRLDRLRAGTYACAQLSGVARTAAVAGMELDCLSFLEKTPNQWVGRGTVGLHLLARGGRHHDTTPDGTTVHWSRYPQGGTIGALRRSVRCLGPYDWLAAIESAVHLGSISPGDVDRLRDGLPPAHAAALERIVFATHSGFETTTRCQLVDAGHQVETQVSIPGTSDLDLLVDGLVGVETDGRRWHEGKFIADRTKDLHLEAWGIRTVRIGEVHIFEEWPQTLATIERMIDEARRARMHTRFLTGPWG